MELILTMVDFVKLVHVTSDIGQFFLKHKSILKSEMELENGELLYPFFGNIEGYKMVIRESNARSHYVVEVTGSLHKNYFGGKNHERFKIQMLNTEIGRLEKLLGINADELVIQNLEFGVNLEIESPPFEYLEENLLLYKRSEFNKYDTGSKNMYLGYHYKGLPSIKIYDKGKQYGLPKNLLRYELRYLKSCRLNEMGISTLDDLRKIECINRLSNKLREHWKSVLLYEEGMDLKNTGMSEKDKKFFKNSGHVKYWRNIIKDKSRTTFYNSERRLKRLIEKHGKNVHKIIGNQIDAEIKKCTYFPEL